MPPAPNAIRVRVRSKPNRPLQLYYLDPLTGRDITRSAGTRDPSEAAIAAAKWELQLEASGQIRKGPMPWDVFRLRFAEEWLRTLRQRSKGSYTTALNHFERLIGVPRDIARIDTDTISRYMGKLIAERRPLTTVGNYVKHVMGALAWAKSRGWVRDVPRIKLPPVDQTNLAKGRPLSDAEIAKLHAAVPKVFTGPATIAEWRRFLRVLRLSGERSGGALQLSWDSPPLQIDLDGGKIPRLIVQGVGQKSRKHEIAPLAPDFAEWLAKIPKSQRHGLLCPLHGRDGAKITTSHGVGNRFAEIAEAAGVDCTAHDLRRTFATYWSSRVRPLTLKRLMRHASLKTTMTYYVGQEAEDVAPDLYPQLYREKKAKRERKATGGRRKVSKKGSPPRAR
jgi:integrase